MFVYLSYNIIIADDLGFVKTFRVIIFLLLIIIYFILS